MYMVSLGQNVLLGRRLTALQGGSIVALENKEALKPDNLGVYLAPLFTGYMTLGNLRNLCEESIHLMIILTSKYYYED